MNRKIDLLSQDFLQAVTNTENQLKSYIILKPNIKILQKEISSQNDINKTLMQIQAISFDNRIGYIQPH